MLEVCKELVVYLLAYYGAVGLDTAKTLTESQCIDYNNKMAVKRRQIEQDRIENSPESLRRKGYVVCEQKGNVTACK